MALTMTERGYWKERVAKRIDKAIEQLYIGKDPGLLERTRAEAQRRAGQELGISKLQQRCDEISVEREHLKKEESDLHRKMVAIIRKCEVSDVFLQSYYHGLPSEVATAVKRLAILLEEELLAENVLGKEVLSLREEKEQLLDSVWLATSSSQIKELWQCMLQRLSQQPTTLQSQALAIAPEESTSQ